MGNSTEQKSVLIKEAEFADMKHCNACSNGYELMDSNNTAL
jgi:hypothetical protein